jgi:hypothetical protein
LKIYIYIDIFYITNIKNKTNLDQNFLYKYRKDIFKNISFLYTYKKILKPFVKDLTFDFSLLSRAEKFNYIYIILNRIFLNFIHFVMYSMSYIIL